MLCVSVLYCTIYRQQSKSGAGSGDKKKTDGITGAAGGLSTKEQSNNAAASGAGD